jgi:aryl-alcohol dehydrogenase-like predicted oxidoreductase
MKYRRLGRSSIEISEIGFGAWGIGGRTDSVASYGKTDDAVSLAALRRALDVGITFYDTSCVYGLGHSEELIGEAFRTDRSRVVIATKAGYVDGGRRTSFAPEDIRQTFDESLRRLKTDYVDVLMLHDPKPEVLGRGDAVDTLEKIVRQGKARAWGVSARSPADAVTILSTTRPQAIEINLNMMDVRALDDGLLDLAQGHGAGIIARTPLCFGFLSGTLTPDTVFPPGDHRNNWPKAQIEAWVKGADALLALVPRPTGSTNTQAALRFCLSFAAVATVIPGMLTPVEVDDNAAASVLGPLPADAVAAVRALNRARSFFVERNPSA